MREVRRPIRVAMIDVANPAGKEAWVALTHWDCVELVLAVDHTEVGKSMRELCGPKGADITIEAKLGEALDRVETDLIVDFGNHAAAAQHAGSALKRNVIPIVGSMLKADELRELRDQCSVSGKPALVAPSFSLGAVLLQRFCKEAARWLDDFEVLDYHYDTKQESSSSSAKLLSELIASSAEAAKQAHPERRHEHERTITSKDVGIHSIRNKGLCPRMSVVFGTSGESLTIEHVAQGPAGPNAGLKLAIQMIGGAQGLVVGLDNLLFT